MWGAILKDSALSDEAHASNTLDQYVCDTPLRDGLFGNTLFHSFRVSVQGIRQWHSQATSLPHYFTHTAKHTMHVLDMWPVAPPPSPSNVMLIVMLIVRDCRAAGFQVHHTPTPLHICTLFTTA